LARKSVPVWWSLARPDTSLSRLWTTRPATPWRPPRRWKTTCARLMATRPPRPSASENSLVSAPRKPVWRPWSLTVVATGTPVVWPPLLMAPERVGWNC